MKEKRQSNAEHKEPGVQRMTGEETSESICKSIYNRRSNIHQCSQIMTTNLNENPSSGKHQLNSIIQRTDKRTEKKKQENLLKQKEARSGRSKKY